LKQELKRRDGWIQELEARATAADTRADQAEGQLEAEREKAQDASLAGVDQFQAQIEKLTKELSLAKHQLETNNRATSERERELASLRARQTELEELLEAGDPEAQKEIGSLEHQLKDRGQEVLRLSKDLRKLEQLSRNLLRELSEVRDPATPSVEEEVSALREKLDQLARKNASKEADLVAMTWTVAALEGEIDALSSQHSAQSAK
jgi:chromosome segregation ATPase